MVTGSNDVDEIYRRMAVIPRELHPNVRESVAGAEAVVDWGRYTWMYPWIAPRVAAAVGYLVYAGSRLRCSAGTAVPADGDKVGEPLAGARSKGEDRSRAGRNLLLAAWGILLPVAVSAGQNHALHWIEQPYRPRNPDRTARSLSGRERRPDGPGGSVGGIESRQRLRSKPTSGGPDDE